MDLNQYARAIASIESAGSGDYQAVGPRTGKGNRAYGRYQVMDFNIGPWTEKYLGQRLTPEQFLSNPEAQDAVFQGEFGSYIDRFGNPQDAASAWFTGRPLSEGAGRSDILGTTGAGYVQKFNAALGQPQGGNMQPQGLLGTMSTRNAPQPEQERTPFFKNPDFWDTLAIGLQGMTLNPNQALIGAVQERMGQRREARETAAQRNATVEFLRSRGREDLAAAIQGGLPAADALRIAMTPAEEQKGVVMGDRLVDPRTGQVLADFSGQAPAFKPEDISAARKEFTGLAPVKSFAEQTSAYGRIIASVEDPSPAGDLALIFNYMKVLDPGSTVREGEFATAEQAGGVDQRVRGLYNRVVSGERLTPEQRADFAGRATRLYENAEQQYRSLADQYASFARAAGLPVEQVIPDFGYSGSLYQTPLEFQVPPPPTGINPEQWRQAWQNMTDEERRQFLQGQP